MDLVDEGGHTMASGTAKDKKSKKSSEHANTLTLGSMIGMAMNVDGEPLPKAKDLTYVKEAETLYSGHPNSKTESNGKDAEE